MKEKTTEDKKALKKQRIKTYFLEAAKEIIINDGVENISVRKVADMAVGDGWVYPTYHKGGEGGEVHGMNYRSDAPAFFEKVVFDTRKFEKKNYLFAIPQEDILRVEKLVQNPGWGIE